MKSRFDTYPGGNPPDDDQPEEDFERSISAAEESEIDYRAARREYRIERDNDKW